MDLIVHYRNNFKFFGIPERKYVSQVKKYRINRKGSDNFDI